MISKYNIHIYIKEIFSYHMIYKFRYYTYISKFYRHLPVVS
jgi:hypothetical protein